MSEKGTTGDSRKKSGEKRTEARKRLGDQRRSGDNINNVMERVAERRTTGFSDTDRQVLRVADKIGASADRVGREDAKATFGAADSLKSHADEMEQKARTAAAEAARVDNIRSNDTRIEGTAELRAGYTQAETVASDISKGDKHESSTARREGQSLEEYVKGASRRRPSFD